MVYASGSWIILARGAGLFGSGDTEMRERDLFIG